MKQEVLQEEVLKILQGAPAARKALLENHQNLLNVSEYCTNNYQKSGEDTLKALEETKNFTTQSLASVAYQISTLASSVLSLLDAQTNQLRHMESSINLIGQTVEMHKEKVSRREIGAFTAVRRVSRGHKILPPNQASTEPRPAYSRRPINYQQLDSLGHGIKVSGKQLERTGTIRKHGASIRTAKAPDPVHCPVVPPGSSSSFGKPVAPPTIPAPPACDTVSPLLDEDVTSPIEVANNVPAPPAGPRDSSLPNVAPPPPPPPPPPAPASAPAPAPPPPAPAASALAPPPLLPTVEEEGGLPSPSPPPPIPEEDLLSAIPSEASELPAPPPPPPANEEGDGFSAVTLLSRRSRHRRSPPASRSVSLRVRSGPASRSRYTRSLFLPAVQPLMIPPPPPYPPPHAPPFPPSTSSPRLRLPARLEHLDLEIPAPPPPLLLDDFGVCDDSMVPLPPPVDDDTMAPLHYLDKVVVLYDYQASRPDDLTLAEGDVVYLTHRHDDGWCEGVLRGNTGFFPENYVQSCD